MPITLVTLKPYDCDPAGGKRQGHGAICHCQSTGRLFEQIAHLCAGDRTQTGTDGCALFYIAGIEQAHENVDRRRPV